MKRAKLFLILVVAALFIAGGIYYFKSTSKETKPIETAKVFKDRFEISVGATGEIQPEISVELKSRASGEVVEVNVEAGDTVSKGDILIKLDPEDEERNLSIAEATLFSARSKLAQTEASLASSISSRAELRDKYSRRKDAFEKGLVSAEELQSANTTLEVSSRTIEERAALKRSAGSDLQKASLSISEARKRLKETIISAPISGTVLNVTAEKGAIVSSGITNVGGGSTLMTLADLSSLYVLAKIDEADIGRIKIGDEARIKVDAFQKKNFSGRVSRITPLGVNDANVVTFDVKIEVTDKDANLLLPGMSSDIEIISHKIDDALQIPLKAIKFERRQNSGARRPASENVNEQPNRKGTVTLVSGETREITIGISDGINAVILSGLSEGDEVIIPEPEKNGGAQSILSVGRPKR